MKRLLAFMLGLLAFIGLVMPAVVFAAYDYYIPVTVYNNSTATYSYLPVLATINNSQLHSLGYIDADGLDTRLLEDVTDRVFMVDSGRLGFVIPSLLEDQDRTYNYRLNESPGQTAFPVIVGVGGNVTISDDADLELGGNFTILQRGYIDTSAGSSKNLVYKEDAFRLYVSAAGNITADIWSGGDWSINVTATDVYTGLHTINVTTMNSDYLKISVDDVEKDSIARGGVAVADNGNYWVLMENEVLVWMEYLKVLTR